MANEVFGATTGAPIVIKSDKATIEIDRKKCLALGVQIQFQRQVQVLPVLSDKRVMSVGEPQGTISIDTLLIKDNQYDITSADWIKGDGCKPKVLDVSFKDNQCTTKTKKVSCSGCIASAVSVGMQGGRGYVASGVQITFTGMQFK